MSRRYEGGLGGARDLQRRLHPHHRATASPRRAALHAGDLRQRLPAKRRLRGLVLRLVRGLLHRGRARSREPLPDPRAPGRVVHRGELVLRAEPFRGAAARLVRRASRWRSSPRPPQRGARASSSPGLQDISDHADLDRLGDPVPWDPSHVFYVWYDALVNYISAIGYGRGRVTSSPSGGRRSATCSARTSCASTACGGRRCAWLPGSSRRRRFVVHGFLLVGGKKMGKSAFNQIDPVELGPRHRQRRLCATTCAGRSALGSDGEFTYEGLVARYNSDLANNLGNLMSRVATVVGSKCGGIGPAPSARRSSRLAAVAGEVVRRRGGAWRAFCAAGGARGDVAPHPRGQCRARGGRARGSASPGRRSTPSSAMRSRCSGSWRS